MYVSRQLKAATDRALEQFPAVFITGPRQSGKTTFLRREYGEHSDYVTFDDPLEREFATADPEGFLDRFADIRVILDEVQYVPQLFPYVKMRIDQDRQRNGRWILTGSQQFRMMQDISESLAGRVAILNLLPFSLTEVEQGAATTLASLVWHGLYPELALHPEKRELWVRAYVETYIQRDVRQLTNVRDLAQFEHFISVCASRHGQEFNNADVGRACGISEPTVKSWLGILEAAFVAFTLRPYYRNLGKRLVKRSKFYFQDPALVSYLTRQPSGEAALAGPMGGALVEGVVVMEAAKVFAYLGKSPELYFWRTRDGLELDLLVGIKGKLLPVEVKLTATPTSHHTRPLVRIREILGTHAADESLLVCQVARKRPLPNGVVALPWREFPAWLASRLSEAAP